MRRSTPFLIALASHMDHGIISNGQIVWWGLLRLAPIICYSFVTLVILVVFNIKY